MSAKILIVDDDDLVRRSIQFNLNRSPYSVSSTDSPVDALLRLKEEAFDVVITDVMMPEMDGLTLLTHIKHSYPSIRVVVMTAQGSVKDAVTAIQNGASHYLQKPIDGSELRLLLTKVLKEKKLEEEVVQLRAEVHRKYSFEHIIGNTPGIVACFETVEAIADSDALVLLSGQTGTGKELFARAIHYQSKRNSGPFLAINCAALPDTLLESELFGHEKGAFTGAARQHLGKFEQASGGTLLLDEIGEIKPSVQVKLLRVLQSGEIQRIGGRQTIQVDTRILAATNKNLREMVQKGSFREDLFYRLNVVNIEIPPLLERIDDIPLLVNHFIGKFNQQHKRSISGITQEALFTLQKYNWPGNIRELEHAVERAVLLASSNLIEPADLPTDITQIKHVVQGNVHQQKGLVERLRDFERGIIQTSLRNNGWIQARSAKELNLSRASLNQRIKRLGITIPK